MTFYRIASVVAVAVACWAGPLCAQSIAVGGAVPQPYTLTDSVLAALPRVEVRAADHGQPEATYSGVTLRDVVARAGAPTGGALRGPALATYVLCTAGDGYHVVFTLAELDSAFSDRVVLVATRRDGQPLPEREGHFRIVVPGDQRPARWMRQLTAITIKRGDEP
jgi:DMSO/TMAO reductase YedYZ molybdopterin-dependent catalytic subunit